MMRGYDSLRGSWELRPWHRMRYATRGIDRQKDRTYQTASTFQGRESILPECIGLGCQSIFHAHLQKQELML